MKKINVTKTFLPPIEEYNTYVQSIWDTGQLTNQGPLLKEFEARSKDYLGVDNFHFVSNGTVALQLALRALNITSGEVITTPFSYVATTSSILWEHCKPVFVDIDHRTLNIDPEKIEAAITPQTKAIMAVHVFGYPCAVDKIAAIAKKHNLKVIYDAAHAFGVNYNNRSILDYGDISVTSFHATKLFHTIEGGGIVVKDKVVSSRIELLKRFGHNNDEHTILGINAKASEFQAAMGLCLFNYIDEIIAARKAVFETYDTLLDTEIMKPSIHKDYSYNYSYFPILLKDEKQLHVIKQALEADGIFPRRYFYPSLNRLSYIKHIYSCPISEDISSRIICLPLYKDLAKEDLSRICSIVNMNWKQGS